MGILKFLIAVVLASFLELSTPLLMPVADAHAATASLQEVKFAFIENFTKYVTWPPLTFESSSSEFRACVVGNGTVSKAFEIHAKSIVNTHSIRSIRITSADEAPQCHFIYFGDSADGGLTKRVLKAVEGKPVLTIGEVPGFITKGGIIKFKQVEKKLAFEINPAAARQSGLEISSRLLKLATIVSERTESDK